MALPPSTANWHWKNKNCTRWGAEWLEKELVGISATGDKDEIASISKVSEVDGDIELGQRKSKLLTIFDVKIELKWEGKTADGTEVQGTLSVPEVSHEVICDQLSDFTFNWSLKTTASPEVDAVFNLARSRLPGLIKAKLAAFPQALVDAHGRDLTISADPSRSGTPALATGTAPVVPAPSSSAVPASRPKPAERKGINITTITVEANFQASAEDLYGLLTDEKRIPMWTRATAVSQGKAGTEYSLFGGGVKGKYISLSPNKQIIQSWILQSPTWPSGHEATLTTTLDQSSDSTKVTFALAGVPLGREEELKRNIEGYYVHGFKSIGYVYLLPTAPVYSSEYIEKKSKMGRRLDSAPSKSSTPITAVAIAIVVLIAAFAIPYLSSSSIAAPPPVSSHK